jgi:hypothetical protein
MKRQFIVVSNDDTSFNYIVNDLNGLIEEMYSVELADGESIELVRKWFMDNHKVFEVIGEVREIN